MYTKFKYTKFISIDYKGYIQLPGCARCRVETAVPAPQRGQDTS